MGRGMELREEAGLNNWRHPLQQFTLAKLPNNGKTHPLTSTHFCPGSRTCSEPQYNGMHDYTQTGKQVIASVDGFS